MNEVSVGEAADRHSLNSILARAELEADLPNYADEDFSADTIASLSKEVNLIKQASLE